MENLEIYEKVRVVPEEAKKKIGAGRLKGFTDINPMWRIKTLTEQFGACGIGWYTDVIQSYVLDGSDGQKVQHVDINLYVKVDGEWSKPIFGTGGSMFIANESRGAYTSDEAKKMAYTDALSVACKSLGIGADVYWEKDKTKYDEKPEQSTPKPPKPLATDEIIEHIIALTKSGDSKAAREEYNKYNFTEAHLSKIKAVKNNG